MTDREPQPEDYTGLIRTTSLVLAVLISLGITFYAISTSTFDIHLPIVAWLVTVIAYFTLPRPNKD